MTLLLSPGGQRWANGFGKNVGVESTICDTMRVEGNLPASACGSVRASALEILPEISVVLSLQLRKRVHEAGTEAVEGEKESPNLIGSASDRRVLAQGVGSMKRLLLPRFDDWSTWGGAILRAKLLRIRLSRRRSRGEGEKEIRSKKKARALCAAR